MVQNVDGAPTEARKFRKTELTVFDRY